MTKLLAACASDQGEYRENNEDNFLFFEQMLPEQHESTEILTAECGAEETALFAVFDGMGGASYGEKASYNAAAYVRRFRALFFSPEYAQHTEKLSRLLRREADWLKVNEMGTTFAAVQITGEKAVILSLGDSRVYLLRGRTLYQLTEDHNDAAMLQELGVSNRAPGLTQYLGMDEGIIIQPCYTEGKLHPGDRLLLCTDGLFERETQLEILRFLRDEDTPDKALRGMLRRARELRSRDNITLITVFIQ